MAEQVLLVGANPGVQLYDDAGLTAYASLWRVDWSPAGRGRALVLWRPDGVRLLGTDAALCTWLERGFTRWFPEVAGLPWPEPAAEVVDVELGIDLGSGAWACAADVEVAMSEVLDRRVFATDDFDLGGTPHGLGLVLAPCARAVVREAGHELPGAVRLSAGPRGPGSSAFVTDAEVWRTSSASDRPTR